MLVFGTAGHVDHGKSSLVKALTGIDPDRLPEEKERGLTIALGYAWMDLPGGTTLGLVDVPGHERFVRNMVTGVGGIDGFIFIVAADDGWMPQSEEHLQILRLLGLKKGIGVVTKTDLVDAARVDDLVDEVKLRFLDVTGDEIPVHRFSAVTGEGLDPLRDGVLALADAAGSAPDDGRPRLWIDRVFPVQGAGTVVTGTLRGGALVPGDALEVLPGGAAAEVRELQSYGKHVDRALPGSRTAVNLVRCKREEVHRGDCLVPAGEGWTTRVFDGMTTVLQVDANLGRKNVEVEVHLGTRTVRALSIPLETRSGDRGTVPVRFKLKEAAPVRFGDRFLVRTRGQTHTLGGGWAIDPDPARAHAVGIAVAAKRPAPTLEAFIDGELERHPVLPLDRIVRLTSFSRERIGELKARVDSGLCWTDGWVGGAADIESARTWLVDTLEAFHRKDPSSPGLDLPSLAWPEGIAEPIREEAVRRLEADGTVKVASNRARLAKHESALSGEEESVAAGILARLAEKPFFPETKHALGIADRRGEQVLDYLVRSGRVTPFGKERFLRAEDFAKARDTVLSMIRENGAVTLREVRDRFGASRAAVQAILDAMDAADLTVFDGDKRTLGKGGAVG